MKHLYGVKIVNVRQPRTLNVTNIDLITQHFPHNPESNGTYECIISNLQATVGFNHMSRELTRSNAWHLGSIHHLCALIPQCPQHCSYMILAPGSQCIIEGKIRIPFLCHDGKSNQPKFDFFDRDNDVFKGVQILLVREVVSVEDLAADERLLAGID